MPARATPASAASVVVNTATVGVPSAAARCVRPVSTPTTASAWRASVASSASVCRGRHDRRRGARGQPFAALPLPRAAPRQQRHDAGAREPGEDRAPAVFGPQLVVAARRVERERVRRCGHGRGRRGRRELPARRARHRVAQRCGRERARLVDEMPVPRDPVVDVVQQRRQRLPDAVPVEAVASAARDARDDRALHLLLQVENRRVRLAAQRVPERAELAPRLDRGHFRTPAAKRDRDDGADARIEPDERHEGFLRRPVDREVRHVRADVGDQRHRVHDIAQRRWPDDQHAAHRRARPMTGERRAGGQTT